MAQLNSLNLSVQEIRPNDYLMLGGVLYRVYTRHMHPTLENRTEIWLLDDRINGAHSSDIVEMDLKNDTMLDIMRVRN